MAMAMAMAAAAAMAAAGAQSESPGTGWLAAACARALWASERARASERGSGGMAGGSAP